MLTFIVNKAIFIETYLAKYNNNNRGKIKISLITCFCNCTCKYAWSLWKRHCAAWILILWVLTSAIHVQAGCALRSSWSFMENFVQHSILKPFFSFASCALGIFLLLCLILRTFVWKQDLCFLQAHLLLLLIDYESNHPLWHHKHFHGNPWGLLFFFHIIKSYSLSAAAKCLSQYGYIITFQFSASTAHGLFIAKHRSFHLLHWMTLSIPVIHNLVKE